MARTRHRRVTSGPSVVAPRPASPWQTEGSCSLGLLLLALAYGSTLGINLWLTRFNPGMLLWPLSALFSLYLMPRAAILGGLRGGIYWRGTFYPNAALAAGVRLGSLS
jgi:hypothetical protein